MLSVSIRVLSFESVIIFWFGGLAGHFAGVEGLMPRTGRDLYPLKSMSLPDRV